MENEDILDVPFRAKVEQLTLPYYYKNLSTECLAVNPPQRMKFSHPYHVVDGQTFLQRCFESKVQTVIMD